MSKYTSIVILSLFFIGGCSKEDEIEINSANFTFNGSAGEATGYISYLTGYESYSMGFNFKNPFDNESYLFYIDHFKLDQGSEIKLTKKDEDRKEFWGVQEYKNYENPPDPYAGGFTAYWGGDVGTGFYDVDTTKHSFIFFTEVKKKSAKGNIRLNMIKRPHMVTYPDGIRRESPGPDTILFVVDDFDFYIDK